jgi:transposase-like protein
MLITFISTFMAAEAAGVCGAGYGERTDERTNARNGYRHRDRSAPAAGCSRGERRADSPNRRLDPASA